MRFVQTALVLLLVTISASAQTTISGRVADETGLGVPGVTVGVSGPAIEGERTTVTDPEGSFLFTNLPAGQYEVIARLEGFATTSVSVTAGPGQASSVQLTFRGASTSVPDGPPFTIVRVHFGTNRTRVNHRRTAHDYDARPAELSFGSATVSIPRDHRLGDWEQAISEGLARQEHHVMILTVTPRGRPEFVGGIRARVEQSAKREAFVFVHGYNTSFSEAIQRTALLAYDLKFDGAPIAFTWPSRGAYLRYPADEEAAQNSIEDLEVFLQLLANESGATRIHLIAHSMGNRVLLEALRSLQLRNLQPQNLANLVLAAPDVNIIRFKQLMPFITDIPGRATLYASSRDRALRASRIFHGYRRAGEGGSRLPLLSDMDSVDVTSVDTSLTGHAYYGDNRSVITDLYDLIRNDTPPEARVCLSSRQAAIRFWIFDRCQP